MITQDRLVQSFRVEIVLSSWRRVMIVFVVLVTVSDEHVVAPLLRLAQRNLRYKWITGFRDCQAAIATAQEPPGALCIHIPHAAQQVGLVASLTAARLLWCQFAIQTSCPVGRPGTASCWPIRFMASNIELKCGNDHSDDCRTAIGPRRCIILGLNRPQARGHRMP